MQITEQTRIVIIGPAWPLKGGIAQFTERLAQQFQDEGNYCAVYSFSFLYPNFLFPGKEQRSKIKYQGKAEIVSCINALNPINWLRVAYAIRHIEQPHILIINFWIPYLSPCLGAIARMVKRKRATTVIGIAHNVIPHEKRPFDTLLIKYFCNAIGGWVTMSEKVMVDLMKFVNIKKI